jgi:hypothetical protein
MDKQEVIRRLVFIKYLYNLGVEQSKKAEPYCWTSVLTFHDTVELFLLLAAEYLHISGKTLKQLTFLGYWDCIDPELKEKGKEGLTQRIAMEKLNEVRIAFKHHGTSPSLDTINSAKVNVGNFLEENSDLVFEVRFSEISLIELIQFEEARTSLKQAIQLFENGDIESAIDKIATAFHQLVDDYVDRKRDGYGRSEFDFPSFGSLRRADKFDRRQVEFREAFHDLDRGLERLNETTKMIALGIDYRKYLRFEKLTAREIERLSGSYRLRRLDSKVEGKLTAEDVQFCIDFVIECAIILKENDFEFKPKKERTLADMF